MLSRHLFFDRPVLLSQKPLVLAILHRCVCVLASISGQTTLNSLFVFQESLQQVISAPPSWCLHLWCAITWSSLLCTCPSQHPRLNLVCSHLSFLRSNIQNLMPFAGLVIVLQDFDFQFATGIFLSHVRVIPCQIIRWFPRTSSDSFEIRHTCRNCLENNIRPIFFYLGQARSEIWPCEKMEKWRFLGQTRISNGYKSSSIWHRILVNSSFWRYCIAL